jgi:hypothetical protein
VADIVSRLRDMHCTCRDVRLLCDACFAADEIERLRAERDSLSMQLDLVRAYL